MLFCEAVLFSVSHPFFDKFNILKLFFVKNIVLPSFFDVANFSCKDMRPSTIVQFVVLQIRAIVKLLRQSDAESTGEENLSFSKEDLENTLKYSSKHANSPTTPKAIRNMLSL